MSCKVFCNHCECLSVSWAVWTGSLCEAKRHALILAHVRHISICKYKGKLASALKPAEMGSSSPWRPSYLLSTSAPCQAAGSSLWSADTHLGNITSSELLWRLSRLLLCPAVCPRASLGDRVTLSQDNTPTLLFTAACFFTGKPCPAQSVCHHCWLGLTWPYPCIIAFLFQMCGLQLCGSTPQGLLYNTFS